MLRHLGDFEAANQVENAVLVTLEDGKTLTGDVVGYDQGASTSAFTDAVIANLGRTAQRWQVRDYRPLELPRTDPAPDTVRPHSRRVVGADVFLESTRTPAELGKSLEEIVSESPLRLKMISNRGTMVYPSVGAITDCVDHWRCRFVLRPAAAELPPEVLEKHLGFLLLQIGFKHRWMHVEKLSEFDGSAGFTKAQGED
jgi:isocitrate dehydrogenase